MKLPLIAVAAAFAAASAAPALAQAPDWTGGYVGGVLGYGFQKGGGGESILFDKNLDGAFNDTVNTAAGANAFSPGFCGGAAKTSAPGGGCGKDDDGVEYGARAGYDWQLASGLVLGVVGEITKPDVKDSVSAFSTTPAFYTMTRELDYVAALRGRVGFAVDRYLPYVTAGLARGKTETRFATSNTANTFVQSGSDKANGYQLGAGVETKIAANWSVGVEYLYTRLDDDNYRVRAQGPAPATNPFILTNTSGTDFRRSEDRFDMHSVRATLAYRF